MAVRSVTSTFRKWMLLTPFSSALTSSRWAWLASAITTFIPAFSKVLAMP